MTRGRPTKYDPERHPDWAKSLARLGKTNEEIAADMGISPDTFQQWRKRYPEFSVSVKTGKSEADSQVEASLFKQAVGFETTEVKITDSDKDGHKEESVTKVVPGNPAAAIFWLKNRKPAEWRDKVQTEVTGKDGGPIRIVKAEDLSDDELAAIVAGKSG